MTDEPEAGAVVRTRALERRFDSAAGGVLALGGIDLEVRRGEYIAIRGTSGSGKSTLLQILGLLDRPTGGEYELNGLPAGRLPERERTRLRNEEIGFVFQSFQLLDDRSAIDNVKLPLEYRRSTREANDPAAMLERVGLAGRATHRPGQLSGGEKQRVAIARAIVKRPSLLLLDEPTGNLDERTGQQILALLDEVRASENPAMIMVTHDREVAARADRELELRDGRWRDPESTS